MRWSFLQVADQTMKGFVIALVATWLGNDHLVLAVVPALAMFLAVLSTFVGDRSVASFLSDD
jgi:hypothetical protein